MRTLALVSAVVLGLSPLMAQAAMSPAPTKAQLDPANQLTDEQKAAQERNKQLTDQLQDLLQSNNAQQALSQGLAVSTLLGCTRQKAGAPLTDAFYKQMEGVGQQVAQLCKEKKPAEARALVLQTLKSNQYNQVVMAANNCYSQNKANFDTMAGPVLSKEVGNYARWVRDPRAAQREVTEAHICH
jgi:hypothetical protein